MLYRLWCLLGLIAGIAVLGLFLTPTVHGPVLVLHGPVSIFRAKCTFLLLLLSIALAGRILAQMLSSALYFAERGTGITSHDGGASLHRPLRC